MRDHDLETNRQHVEEVYRREAPRLWRALVGFTGEPEAASDAVSEAFARALHDQASIRDLGAWVWVVAFRIAAAEVGGSSGPADDEAFGTYELQDALPDLVAALRKLSPNQRLAIVLHDYADRPTQEIADVLGSSRATTYVHLSQGRRRLRKLLEAHDE